MPWLVGSIASIVPTFSFLATSRASLWWPGEYFTTELARWGPTALSTVPLVNPAASTRSPMSAARPGTVVPFRTATVILDAFGVGFAVALEVVFFFEEVVF